MVTQHTYVAEIIKCITNIAEARSPTLLPFPYIIRDSIRLLEPEIIPVSWNQLYYPLPRPGDSIRLLEQDIVPAFWNRR